MQFRVLQIRRNMLRMLWHVVAIALRLDGIRNASEFHLVENAPAVGTACAIMAAVGTAGAIMRAPRVARPGFSFF